MKWVVLVLVVITAIFLLVSFAQDIKERTVYSLQEKTMQKVPVKVVKDAA